MLWRLHSWTPFNWILHLQPMRGKGTFEGNVGVIPKMEKVKSKLIMHTPSIEEKKAKLSTWAHEVERGIQGIQKAKRWAHTHSLPLSIKAAPVSLSRRPQKLSFSLLQPPNGQKLKPLRHVHFMHMLTLQNWHHSKLTHTLSLTWYNSIG